MRKEIVAFLVLSVLLIAAGGAAGWYFTKPTKVIETAKPAETQADGSVIVERAPTAPKTKPKQIVPKGARVERASSVTVQPTAAGEIGKPCPPVTVDMTLIREQDGSKRVIASSPDGQVVAGVDIPVETIAPAEERPWAAGVSLDPIRQTMGAWVERDIGRIRVGVEINQTRQTLTGPVAAEVRARLGWVF